MAQHLLSHNLPAFILSPVSKCIDKYWEKKLGYDLRELTVHITNAFCDRKKCLARESIGSGGNREDKAANG